MSSNSYKYDTCSLINKHTESFIVKLILSSFGSFKKYYLLLINKTIFLINTPLYALLVRPLVPRIIKDMYNKLPVKKMLVTPGMSIVITIVIMVIKKAKCIKSVNVKELLISLKKLFLSIVLNIRLLSLKVDNISCEIMRKTLKKIAPFEDNELRIFNNLKFITYIWNYLRTYKCSSSLKNLIKTINITHIPILLQNSKTLVVNGFLITQNSQEKSFYKHRLFNPRILFLNLPKCMRFSQFKQSSFNDFTKFLSPRKHTENIYRRIKKALITQPDIILVNSKDDCYCECLSKLFHCHIINKESSEEFDKLCGLMLGRKISSKSMILYKTKNNKIFIINFKNKKWMFFTNKLYLLKISIIIFANKLFPNRTYYDMLCKDLLKIINFVTDTRIIEDMSLNNTIKTEKLKDLCFNKNTNSFFLIKVSLLLILLLNRRFSIEVEPIKGRNGRSIKLNNRKTSKSRINPYYKLINISFIVKNDEIEEYIKNKYYAF
mmetsp:Transcript_14774/g.20712  ORF Transcript_14774/g.20712 Transcript_14774/m.20712 type:complete len:491 (-) Transcript_14774:247-1719(-)